MLRFHDPRGVLAVAPEPYGLTVELSSTPSVGLLANGFPDSVAFLDAVGEALRALLPGIELHAFDKGDASSTVSDEMLDELVGRCEAVVAAYGH